MVIESSNMGCYWPLTRSRRADYVGWRGRPVERHYAAACRARRKRTGRPVAWRTVGKLGATARRVRYRMIGDINDRPDVLIVCVGGNDMLAGRSVREWAAGLAPVLDAAKNKAGKVMLFSSGQPHRSPVLPRAAPRHRTPHQRADRHEPATVRDARHRLPRPDPYR